MTISNTTIKYNYTSNGITAAYAFSSPVLDESHLQVWERDASTGAETLNTITTDYTVVIAGDNSSATVTFVTASIPPAGDRITIKRVVPLTQTTDFENYDGNPADANETEFDKGAMADQQLQEELNRAIKVPATSTFDPTIADPAENGGLVLGVNSAGDAFEWATGGGGGSGNDDRILMGTMTEITFADSPYSVTNAINGNLIVCNTTNGAITVTLPEMAAESGDLRFGVMKLGGDTNDVTVQGQSGELVNGAATATQSVQYKTVTYMGDKTNERWYSQNLGASPASINVDQFTGDGADTTFDLTNEPGTENNVWIAIDGIYQNKDTYSVSGTTITFDTAPPNTLPIECVYLQTEQIGIPSDDTVTTVKIQDLAVTTAKLAADAVTGAKIADDTIDSEHYVAGSIDNEHMAANSIDSDQYVDGSIDQVHLAAGIVGVDEIDTTEVGALDTENEWTKNQHYPQDSISSSSGTLTWDLADSPNTTTTLTEDVTTVTLSNPQTGSEYAIRIVQDSTARAVTWPSSVKWPGGTAPTITTTSGAKDRIVLYCDDEATPTYLGNFSQDYS